MTLFRLPGGGRIYVRRFICAALVGLVWAPGAYTQEEGDRQGSYYAALARGYEAMSKGSADAVRIFEDIVREYPVNVIPRRQLGSLYIAAGRVDDALSQFIAADSLLPSDTTKLQIGYLYSSLRRYDDARATFGRLEGSPDPDIRGRSSAAAAMLGWMISEGSYPWWGRLCGDPYYDGRFDNSVVRFWAMGGVYLTESKSVSAYGVGLFTRDTRSSGGAVPVIYSDSYSLIGGGVRIQPFAGGRIELQMGAAISLIDQQGEAGVRGDVRGLASYGWGLYPDPASPDRPHVRLRPFVEAMAMGGYYSRYENVIGFGHAKAGARVLEWRRAYGDVYLRGDFVADTRREFFNNIVEGSVGVRLVPDFGIGVQVLAEYHRGLYWDRALRTSPYDRWYSSGRLILVLDQPFAL